MKTAILAAALTLAAGTAAIAQPAFPAGDITLAQYQAVSWQRWLARADGNHDGRIAKAEVAAAAGPRGSMIDLIWGRWDTNHNNFLDRAEVDVISAQGFRRADTNHDGKVDMAERAAAQANQRGND